MRQRLSRLWDGLIGSYWLVPTLLALGAFALALAMNQLDRALDGSPGFMGPFYGGEPNSARAILTTVASAMITVVSLTFSVTVVALTLAANQFGPRLLYNFMRDRANQIVLGVFIGTFIYCLLVLRMVGGSTGDWVPHASVLLGLSLGVLDVGVLIFFIHHLIETMQANNVVARVATELQHAVRRVFPAQSDAAPSAQAGAGAEEITRLFEQPPGELSSTREGVLQVVDYQRLLRCAQKYDVSLRLCYRPGEFVLKHSVAFLVWPPRRVCPELAQACSGALLVGARRTLVQDVEFAFDQLIELALRALSPSLNDTFTATACIDRLGAGLVAVAGRAPQPAVLRDKQGVARVVLKTTDFHRLCKRAFEQIRQNARDNLAVLLRLLEVIEFVLRHVQTGEHRQALLAQARMVHNDARACATSADDEADVARRYARLRPYLARAGGNQTRARAE